jgi:hypothetical protein
MRKGALCSVPAIVSFVLPTRPPREVWLSGGHPPRPPAGGSHPLHPRHGSTAGAYPTRGGKRRIAVLRNVGSRATYLLCHPEGRVVERDGAGSPKDLTGLAIAPP